MLPLAQVLSAEIAVRQGDFVTATQWAIRETRPAPLVPAFYCLAPRFDACQGATRSRSSLVPVRKLFNCCRRPVTTIKRSITPVS